MQWVILLLLGAPWAAHADTIYLCKAYSGGMFWSSASCSQQQATVDRIVTVPDGMPWDQQVALGEASVAQGRAVAAPPFPQTVTRQTQPQDSARQSECTGLKEGIAHIDSQMRTPQSAQSQDWLRQRRQQLNDRSFRIQC